MKCQHCGRENCAQLVKEYTDWAREAAYSLLQEFLHNAGEIDDRKARVELFSACLGVAIAAFREATVRVDIANPCIVEMVASVELTKQFQDEIKGLKRMSEAIKQHLEEQVPS